MKKTVVYLFAFVLGVVMTLGVQSLSAAPERHPRIRQAMRALDGAREDLEHAAHDFGGHRVEAIKAIDHAKEQLGKALEFDR